MQVIKKWNPSDKYIKHQWDNDGNTIDLYGKMSTVDPRLSEPPRSQEIISAQISE